VQLVRNEQRLKHINCLSCEHSSTRQRSERAPHPEDARCQLRSRPKKQNKTKQKRRPKRSQLVNSQGRQINVKQTNKQATDSNQVHTRLRFSSAASRSSLAVPRRACSPSSAPSRWVRLVGRVCVPSSESVASADIGTDEPNSLRFVFGRHRSPAPATCIKFQASNREPCCSLINSMQT
jgi:hypothetical protein